MPKTRARPSAKSETKNTSAREVRPSRLGRPAWSGSISFGLVNIPIKLYSAVRNKDVRFHLLHDKDKSRLQEKLYCPVDQEEVSRQDVVKGFEISKNNHVVVSQEEINSLAPKATHTIELMNVVDIHQIDPMYFDQPYYVLPDERAEKAYALLLEALRSSEKGAVAKFVMRNKERIGVLRPIKNVLCMEIMHFADELISVRDLDLPAITGTRDAEVKMARQLLDSLASDFEPEKLHDDYREALLTLIQKKAEGEEIVTQPEKETNEPEVIDLMEALKKSVVQAQQRQKSHKAA